MDIPKEFEHDWLVSIGFKYTGITNYGWCYTLEKEFKRRLRGNPDPIPYLYSVNITVIDENNCNIDHGEQNKTRMLGTADSPESFVGFLKRIEIIKLSPLESALENLPLTIGHDWLVELGFEYKNNDFLGGLYRLTVRFPSAGNPYVKNIKTIKIRRHGCQIDVIKERSINSVYGKVKTPEDLVRLLDKNKMLKGQQYDAI